MFFGFLFNMFPYNKLLQFIVDIFLLICHNSFNSRNLCKYFDK